MYQQVQVWVAVRSKAEAKPQPRESNGMTIAPSRERKLIDIEPSKQNLESYNLSKVVNLLRHNQKLHREDGAIQFYKIKFHLRDHHSQIQNWSDDRWKACLAILAQAISSQAFHCSRVEVRLLCFFCSLQDDVQCFAGDGCRHPTGGFKFSADLAHRQRIGPGAVHHQPELQSKPVHAPEGGVNRKESVFRPSSQCK